MIDVAIVGTVALCAWRGYKNGLIRGVFGIVSLIVALLVANIAAQAYSDEAKEMLVPFVSGIIDSTLMDMAEEGVVYQPLAHDHEIDDEDFGTAYTALRRFGLPESSAVNIAEQTIKNEATDYVRSFSDVIAEKLSSTLSYVAVFGIAFLLLAIVFAVIGNLIGFVFSLPGLKLVDMIAGTALGLCKGIILVYTITAIIRYFGLVIIDTIENTTILKLLINNNPIANMLGI
jgi:uncharacterized membrane protein required for colicin V production